MDSVRSLLPQVLRKRGLLDQAAASLVAYRAQEWLRREVPELGDGVEVSHGKDGVLMVACRDGAMAQECRLLTPKLRSYLHRECPDAVIASIRVERTRRG